MQGFLERKMQNILVIFLYGFDENIVYIQPMHILDDNGSLRFLFWDSKSEKIQDRLLTQLKIEDDLKYRGK